MIVDKRRSGPLKEICIRLEADLASIKKQQEFDLFLWRANEIVETLLNLRYWIVLRQPSLMRELLAEARKLLILLQQGSALACEKDPCDSFKVQTSLVLEKLCQESKKVDCNYYRLIASQYKKLSAEERLAFCDRERAELESLQEMLKRNRQEIERIETVPKPDSHVSNFYAQWKTIEEEKTKLIRDAITAQQSIVDLGCND